MSSWRRTAFQHDENKMFNGNISVSHLFSLILGTDKDIVQGLADDEIIISRHLYILFDNAFKIRSERIQVNPQLFYQAGNQAVLNSDQRI